MTHYFRYREVATIPKISIGALSALITIGIFATILTAGMIVIQKAPPNGTPPNGTPSNGTATTIDLGVYLDSQCVEDCTSINWGTVYPGNSTATTLYVKNIGTCPVTLSMTPANWTPEGAAKYLTLTWDQDDTVLQADGLVAATLTLSADSETEDLTDFNVDIVITGTE